MNNDFNADFVIRNLILFLVFVIVCVFCTTTFLLPKVEEYKKQALRTKESKIVFNRINQDYQAIEAELKNLVVQKYTFLANLYNVADEEKIQTYLQDFFTHVEVKKLSTSSEQQIADTYYQVVGYAPSTQDIQDFILFANKMPYFVRVDLPLKMEFDEKSKQIYFVMVLNLKNSLYQEHQIILDNGLRFDRFKP
ncbi:hypothetical protein LS68_005570 [Helicobacter sp. MIT 05-5293]|uniref:hypothetical protein n=1 Tax=Helicobacter sp. MIT 05-5293 TaxID=1548149 RepID=UPI00051DD878|nr:hypothetical protein [Helicobacter sp. MIT 05-5293]TLD80940.1 hypothetical protein LS68_005570 [Helicobacter sp. MIT 05-5293]